MKQNVRDLRQMRLIHCVWFLCSFGFEMYFTILPFNKSYLKKRELCLKFDDFIVMRYFQKLRETFIAKHSYNIIEDTRGLWKNLEVNIEIGSAMHASTLIGRLQQSKYL